MNLRPALLLLALAVVAPAGSADLLGEEASTDAAIEERVQRALAGALADDHTALAAEVSAFAAEDERRQEAGLPRTGLTDDLRYLAAGLAPSRDAQRQALDDVLDDDPDPVIRALAEHRLEVDDAAAADRLLANDRHNRRAALVNDAVRPLGIFSGTILAAALNPFILAGGVADSLLSTAVNLWHYNRLSTPEREALARYRTTLERSPHTRDAPEIVRAVRSLGAKRSAGLCDETVRLGREALEADDLDHASFYVRAAGDLDGCDERIEQCRHDVAAALAAHATREDAGRWPADDSPQPLTSNESDDHRALLVATALGEPGAMVATASRFRERHPDSAFAPGATYALAVGRDLAGHREAARDALQELAGDGSAAARHAAAVLASPDFNRLEAIRAAERQHARDTIRYVLLGGNVDGRTALHSAVHLGAEGARAAESLGIFNVVGVVTRAWQAWRKDPISNQEIIDRGEQFLAREPRSPDANAVHERLTDAYERAGAYGRALSHYHETREPNPKRVAKLEEKLADQLLTDAEKGGGNPAVLDMIVRHFGTTDAADKARKKLAERHPSTERQLDRDFILAHPALLAPDALDLDPRLLDGERDNGELADAGVTLAPGELRLQLEHDGGEPEKDVRPLTPEAFERARAAAEQALYAQLLTAERRDPDTGRWERYVPVYLQGTVDEGGVYVYPGLKKRRYQPDDKALYE